MFLFAGLLGLFAVGSMAFAVDLSGEDTADQNEDDALLSDEPETIEQIDLVTQDDEAKILSGSDMGDLVQGGAGDDLINGYGEDDQIAGGHGNDSLYGGEGDDNLFGQEGDDTLHGEDGQDILMGDAGSDLLFGHNGDDILFGGDGDDELLGGDGDDMLDGGDGNDALHGGLGDDILTGAAGADTLFGGTGNDTLSGIDQPSSETGSQPATSSVDFLNGGDGNDIILAGEGDIVTAGEGEDTIVLCDVTDAAPAAELMDFDRTEDQLLMVCDMTENPDPLVEIVADSESPLLSHILVDGREVASLHGDTPPNINDIVLIDSADKAAIGLTASL